MAVVVQKFIELGLRFAEQAQYFVVRRRPISVTFGRRKRQQKPFFLAAGEGRLAIHNRCLEDDFGFQQSRQKALDPVNGWDVPEVVSTGCQRLRRRRQLDLSGKTHIPVILARPRR